MLDIKADMDHMSKEFVDEVVFSYTKERGGVNALSLLIIDVA